MYSGVRNSRRGYRVGASFSEKRFTPPRGEMVHLLSDGESRSAALRGVVLYSGCVVYRLFCLYGY